MKVSVVGCGESAVNWHTVPVDISIGVNDAFKFGHRTNWLVVVNSPFKFYPSPKNQGRDRLKVISDHKADRFFCHNQNWRKWYPNLELLALKPFIGRLTPGRVYSSKTSPFVAITLAYSVGASEIILWGVDMVSHPVYSPNGKKKSFDSEFDNYLVLFKQLEKSGIKVYIGDSNTVFRDHLPLYQNAQ